jgi:hypothetical protein
MHPMGTSKLRTSIWSRRSAEMVDLTCVGFIFQLYSSREPKMAFRC